MNSGEISVTPWYTLPNKPVYRCTVWTYIDGRMVYEHVELHDREMKSKDWTWLQAKQQRLINGAKKMLEHNYKVARLVG